MDLTGKHNPRGGNRKMFSRIRPRFTYANVVATLAMVFAMTGGAYAASKILITSAKQIKPSVLAQLKGKTGPAGPVGAAGPAGPQGSAGAKGENGAPGVKGENGTNGASVTSSAEPAGTNCKAGGSKFVAGASTTYACNGENGTTGFTAALPSEQTETGTWGISWGHAGVGYQGVISTSFNIPLELALDTTDCGKAPVDSKCHVHLVAENGEELIANNEGETEKVPQVPPKPCPGTAAAPTAEPGAQCVYVAANESQMEFIGFAALKSTAAGVVLPVTSAVPNAPAIGTWAVTAP